MIKKKYLSLKMTEQLRMQLSYTVVGEEVTSLKVNSLQIFDCLNSSYSNLITANYFSVETSLVTKIYSNP